MTEKYNVSQQVVKVWERLGLRLFQGQEILNTNTCAARHIVPMFSFFALSLAAKSVSELKIAPLFMRYCKVVKFIKY
jgi:hypothetical protein